MSQQEIIKWQKPMTKVLYALLPVVLASIYFLGWRSLVMLLISNIIAFICEYVFARYYKNQVTSSVFVTGTLFALTLPPNLPYWMGAIGIAFGVIFGKMVFGGFGKNIFNPAIAGRAFIYVNFTTFMNGTVWYKPISGILGGFTEYGVDAVTGATPIAVMKTGSSIPLLELLLGNTSGCFGETSAVLIILAGIYLLCSKLANYRLVIGCLIAFLILQAVLFYSGVPGTIPPLQALLSGGFLFGLVYMVTEPVSSAKTNIGRWIYAGLIGALTVIIRTFSFWPEGMMFAILLGNMFAPLIDHFVQACKGGNK